MGKKLLMFIAIVGVGIAFYKCSSKIIPLLIGNPVLVVHIDPIFTKKQKQAIERFCRNKCSLHVSDWVKDLRKQVPLVGHVTSAYDGKSLVINIQAIDLVLLVNNDLVVDTRGNVYTVNFVNPEVLGNLKQVVMTNKAEAFRDEFKKFVQTMPHFLMGYTIKWQSPYVIFLTSPSGYLYLVRYDDIPTQERLIFGERLLDSIGKKNNTVILDFRFADQIIVGSRLA